MARGWFAVHQQQSLAADRSTVPWSQQTSLVANFSAFPAIEGPYCLWTVQDCRGIKLDGESSVCDLGPWLHKVYGIPKSNRELSTTLRQGRYHDGHPAILVIVLPLLA